MWLQGLLGSSVAPLGSRDLGSRQVVVVAGISGVHIFSCMGPASGACVVSGTNFRHTCSGGGLTARIKEQLWAHWQMQASGCFCVLLWLQALSMVTRQMAGHKSTCRMCMYMAAKASDVYWTSSIQC